MLMTSISYSRKSGEKMVKTNNYFKLYFKNMFTFVADIQQVVNDF